MCGSSDEITVKRKRGRPKRSCALKPENSLNENKSDDGNNDQYNSIVLILIRY